MAHLPVEPARLHSHLMDSLHGAIGHPHVPADRKANYTKILAILAADQAKMHAQPQGGMGGFGGPQGPGEAAAGPGAAPGGYGGFGGAQAETGEPMGYQPGIPHLGVPAPSQAPNAILQALRAQQQAALHNQILHALAGSQYG